MIILIHEHPILTGITVAAVLVAMTALGLCLWTLCSRQCGSRRRRGSGRYKNVSNFFPKGGGESGMHIAIPELGVPKAMSSEREKLLVVESDEDEL